MIGFSLDVNNWVKKTGDSVEQANADVMLALFRGVIMDTPVLEGRLRGNWVATKTKPSTASGKAPDKSGRATVARASNFVERLDLTDDFSVYLTNNLPYAHRIEYDGWSHEKAPAGMVRINMDKIQDKL